jgi:hypothetical protein
MTSPTTKVRPAATLETNPDYTPGCTDDDAPLPRRTSLLAIDELADDGAKAPKQPVIYENADIEDDEAVWM